MAGVGLLLIYVFVIKYINLNHLKPHRLPTFPNPLICIAPQNCFAQVGFSEVISEEHSRRTFRRSESKSNNLNSVNKTSTFFFPKIEIHRPFFFPNIEKQRAKKKTKNDKKHEKNEPKSEKTRKQKWAKSGEIGDFGDFGDFKN